MSGGHRATPGSVARSSEAAHTIVVDLGFGDAGKGTVVDWLCSRAYAAGERVPAVVRFNGGAQAAHNVVTDDGRHHTFAQFGSGSFVPGCVTHLARPVLVDPLALLAEADHLESVGVPDPFSRLTVDADALVTTPYHGIVNRARELARGRGAHGSCGMGIGETASYALARPDAAPRVGDCRDRRRLRRLLGELRDWLHTELAALPEPDAPDRGANGRGDRRGGGGAGGRGGSDGRGGSGGVGAGALVVPPAEDCVDAFAAFADAVRIVSGSWLRELCRGPVVFEGAQGVLLDEWHGFHPYTTWSTTTPEGAERLLADAGLAGEALRLGVVRSYTTRHGPGPLVSEDAALTAALPDPHNGTGRWQGAFRVGHFDAVAHRYAAQVAGGLDAIALTHVDVVERGPVRPAVCEGYLIDGADVRRLEPGPPGDLERQAALTRRLLRAAPVLRAAPAATDWPDLVSQVLDAPVTLLSRGPRARDKQRLPVGGAGDIGSAVGSVQRAHAVLAPLAENGQELDGLDRGVAHLGEVL